MGWPEARFWIVAPGIPDGLRANRKLGHYRLKVLVEGAL